MDNDVVRNRPACSSGWFRSLEMDTVLSSPNSSGT